MFFLVSYDIVNDRTRTAVSNVLENYGTRVQKSVFECVITDKQFLELRDKLERLIDHEWDSVRYYRLCKRCQEGVEVAGWGAVTEDPRTAILIV
jgi:CRISPR-associated protein Cas2